jgi:hypothetical protein
LHVKQTRIAVLMVWLAFVIRGVYYSVQLPLWEGLDEWAHFAALEWFAEHGRMPTRGDLVSDEVVRSLELAPLAWSNNGWVVGAVNHDDFWRLPAAERARRRAELARLTAAYRRTGELPSAIQRQYEAQQPPLYYALLAIPYRMTSACPIERQVLWLRCLSLLLASAAIPLAWSLARGLAASRRAAVPVAAFVAAMPVVPLYFARVGNDALAFALMTLALWARRRWVVAGIALGAAMLAKAYALALVPVFLLAAWRDRKMLGALAVALAIAGWWYAGNLASTGTLAGDQMAMTSNAGVGATFAAVPRVAWMRVLDSGAMTHVWIGGWSFLQVRSWMYRAWELVAILGLAGLLRLGRRIDPMLPAAQLLFVLALAYFALSTYVATGISAGVGWYAISTAAVEATLLACGFAGLFGLARARVAMGITVLLALAFDLYTVHFVLAPYYAGLIRHRANGSLEAFHGNALAAVPALWPLYLLANAALAWFALKTRTAATSSLYGRARA